MFPTPPKQLLFNNYTLQQVQFRIYEFVYMRNNSISHGTCYLLHSLLHVPCEHTICRTTPLPFPSPIPHNTDDML